MRTVHDFLIHSLNNYLVETNDAEKISSIQKAKRAIEQTLEQLKDFASVKAASAIDTVQKFKKQGAHRSNEQVRSDLQKSAESFTKGIPDLYMGYLTTLKAELNEKGKQSALVKAIGGLIQYVKDNRSILEKEMGSKGAKSYRTEYNIAAVVKPFLSPNKSAAQGSLAAALKSKLKNTEEEDFQSQTQPHAKATLRSPLKKQAVASADNSSKPVALTISTAELSQHRLFKKPPKTPPSQPMQVGPKTPTTALGKLSVTSSSKRKRTQAPPDTKTEPKTLTFEN